MTLGKYRQQSKLWQQPMFVIAAKRASGGVDMHLSLICWRHYVASMETYVYGNAPFPFTPTKHLAFSICRPWRCIRGAYVMQGKYCQQGP